MPGGGWVMVSNSGTIAPLGGGVRAIRFDATGAIESATRVLGGTNVNCAGGPTPWGTWLSCEEYDLGDAVAPVLPGFPFGPGVAGMVWECDPTGATPGTALPALGVFSHEAVAVDPVTNTVYLTEDNVRVSSTDSAPPRRTSAVGPICRVASSKQPWSRHLPRC